jgi:hypothetical protein
MTALEDRLRTELRAESQLVAPESIPALSLPGQEGRRLTVLRRRGTRRRTDRTSARGDPGHR